VGAPLEISDRHFPPRTAAHLKLGNIANRFGLAAKELWCRVADRTNCTEVQNMKMTEDEYKAFVKQVQYQEQQRETAERLQEDFKVFISYSHTDDDTGRRITDLFDEVEMKN